MKKITNLLVLCSLMASSCSTVTTGQNQSVSVRTGSHKGAVCRLSNDGGEWYVSSTPGSVTIKRDYSDLSINCNKGGLSGSTTVKSSTKGMAFGNIVAGGIIGAAVDVGTGSAYDYPTSINVPLN